MNLPMLDGVGGGAAGTAAGKGTQQSGSAQGFGNVLRTKLEELNSSQQSAEGTAQDLATGRVDDIARALMKVEQADVSLQLATQIRNKAIDAYQEILRMNI